MSNTTELSNTPEPIVFRFCFSIIRNSGEVHCFSKSEVSFSPLRDRVILDAEVSVNSQGGIHVTGKEKKFVFLYPRIWGRREILSQLYYEKDIKSGYRGLIDRIRGKKSFYVEGWVSLAKLEPFTYYTVGSLFIES